MIWRPLTVWSALATILTAALAAMPAAGAGADGAAGLDGGERGSTPVRTFNRVPNETPDLFERLGGGYYRRI